MHNVEISWVLTEIADLIELKGDNPFKARAFRKVARVLSRYSTNLASLPKEQLKAVLSKIEGVGKAIEGVITEIITTRESKILLELREEIPSELRQLLIIPGLGPAKAGLIYRELKITNIQQLQKAAKKRLIRQLPGMGSKTEQTILRGIKMAEQGIGSIVPIGLALAIAKEFEEFFRDLDAVSRFSRAGELRRGEEMVSEVVFVVLTNTTEIIPIIQNHPLLRETRLQEDNLLKGVTWMGAYVEFNFVNSNQFIPFLFYKTGSQEHWQQMSTLLSQKGYTLGQKEILTETGEDIIIKDEKEIYELAGITYIYPELRENHGEIEASLENRLPNLVTNADYKGDLHIHSDWSDGVNTIEDICQKAIESNYEYIAITDHSKSLGIAGGLKEDRLEKQHREIRKLNKNYPNLHILTGVEMDILGDGRLDYSDDILAEMDIVIASIHSGFQQDKGKITERIINAIKNEHVDIIAHPTGRLLGRREPYQVDLEKVLEMAAKYNTALEINSSPDRLDLNSYWVRKAKDLGVKIAINTDAHDLNRMDEISFGLGVGRKGWLEAENILNCLSYEDLAKYLGNKK